jgi:septum formation inhibitor MinC
MSPASSVARAAAHEDHLAGTPAHPPGSSSDEPHAPVRDAASDRDAGVLAGRYQDSVLLRGTTRGLEILISGAPSTAALGARLTELLAEAPGFFAGSSARVAIEGVLPGGALACLEEVATRFEVQIVEIGPVAARRRRPEVPPVLRPDDVPEAHLAEGTGPIAEDPGELRDADPDAASAARPAPATATIEAAPAVAAPSAAPAYVDAPPYATPLEVALANTAPVGVVSIAAAGPAMPAPGAAPADASAAATDAAVISAAPGAAAPGVLASAAATLAAASPGPRLVMGPVRSGMIVDHTGHVIVIGDVNPGAEVRAEGSIIVLGRLRGVAHAAIGREAGCIVALSLQPQQLRIGRMVARAADADRPSDGAEIAYVTGETIVVERFFGRLPSGLAASM